MDENKIWELAQSVERTVTRQEHIAKLVDRLQLRMEELGRRDDHQEERMAQIQESVSSLAEAVHRVEETSMRLRRTAFGFIGILVVLAVLTGILGWDILLKALKAGIATLM